MSLFRLVIAHLGLRTCRRLAIGLLAGLLAASPTWAQKPPNITPGEMAMIPKYCPDTMGFNYGDAYYNTSPRAAYWVGLMGKSFWAIHHHCWGLIKIRRAQAPGAPAQVREAYLQGAINEFNYVIANTPPDFVMLPEVYLRQGESYLGLKNVGAASEAFAQSRRLKPDYAPPYLRWAEVLEKIGQTKNAQSLIEDGLRFNRKSPELQAQYKRLGGNVDSFLQKLPPLPDPVPAPGAAGAPIAAASGTPAPAAAPAAASAASQ